MIYNRKKNFLLSTVLMNCLVQQSLPETTDEEYSPYRENFHSVEDFMWLDFENVQNLFLIMIAMKKKTATNNSNFPFLSFFFSFSAWFQVYLGWGEGVLVLMPSRLKNPGEYVFTLTALCPHLRLYEFL